MHGRGRCWTRSAPGSSVSTETRSKMGGGDCGHGNDMARRRQARPWSEDGARGRERRGRARDKQQELTAVLKISTGGSGTAWLQRTDDGDRRHRG